MMDIAEMFQKLGVVPVVVLEDTTGISPAYPPAHKITVSFTISSV